MPTLGMHALIGFLLGSQTKSEIKTVAIVFGSLIPDIDLIVGVITYFLPGGSIDVAKQIHRSWSHSFITILVLFISGLIIYQITNKNIKSNLSNMGIFITLMSIGMIFHSIADVIYIGYYSHIDALDPTYNPGVQLFWPLLDNRFALFPIEVDDLVYNFLITSDFLTDSLFLYFPVLYLAYRYNTSITVRKPLLIVAIVDFIIFLALTIVSLFLTISTDDMIFITYLPGVLDIILVLIFPLLTHETIGKIYWPLKT